MASERTTTPFRGASDAACDDRARAGTAQRRVVRSEEVLSGHREVDIVHGDVRYRLSVTHLGKLILTK